jgi:uncharacterized protein YciI
VTDGPPGLTRYSLVLLRRPADAPDLPESELDRIQELHLAHLAAMRERGVLLASGPFDDQADPSLRGLCVYGSTPDEARGLAARDPAVQAGRLAADVLSWWTQPGVIGGAARP